MIDSNGIKNILEQTTSILDSKENNIDNSILLSLLKKQHNLIVEFVNQQDKSDFECEKKIKSENNYQLQEQAEKKTQEQNKKIEQQNKEIQKQNNQINSANTELFSIKKSLQDANIKLNKIDIAMKTSRSTLQTILNNINTIIYVVDIDTQETLFANQQAVKIFGNKLPLSKEWQSPELQQQILKLKADIYNSTQEHDSTMERAIYREYQDKSTKHWYHCNNTVIKWIDGRYIWIVIASNITKQKEDLVTSAVRERYLNAIVLIQWYLMIFEGDSNYRSKILSLLGEASGANRVSIFENSYDSENRLLMNKLAEWTDNEKWNTIKDDWISHRSETILENDIEKPSTYSGLYRNKFCRWQKILSIEKCINEVESEFNEKEVEALKSRHVKGFLLIPLFVKDVFFGFISFDNCETEKKWDNSEIKLLRSVANSLSLFEEQRFAKLELRKSKETFENIIKSSPDAIIVHNIDGKITECNNEATKLFEADGDNGLIHKNLLNLFASTDKELMKKDIIITLDREMVKNKEYTMITNSGKNLHIDFSISVIKDLNENPVSFVSILKDITKRKETEKELHKAKQAAENANRAKSDFLANMSHEIRTPLNAILGFSEILKEKLKNYPNYHNYIDDIIASGKSLFRLINDILDLSKIEAGYLDIQKEVVDIHSLLYEIKQLFSIKINEKKLLFDIVIKNDIPKGIYIDEVRLRQVLFNIVGNAVKFTPAGNITIIVEAKFPYNQDDINKIISKKIILSKYKVINRIDIKISIKDSGIGIPKKQQTVIFDPFIQKEGQSTRKYGGTGLGLAISKRLVEMMNGTITLKSNENKGSKFTIHLFDVDVIDLDNDFSNLLINKSNIKFKHAKILVVDDRNSNLKLIVEILETIGSFDIYIAKTGKEAVEQYKKLKPQMILMDIQMPVLDGIEATKQIKALAGKKSPPIIALTALAMKDQRTKIMNVCDGYISKPISLIELKEMLSVFLPIIEEENNSEIINLKSTDFIEDTIQYLSNIEKLDSRLINKLDNELKLLHSEIQKILSIDGLKNFANCLIDTAEEFNVKPLLNYGNLLLDLAGNLQFDKIMVELPKFSKLIDITNKQ